MSAFSFIFSLMEKAGVKKVIYLFLALLKHRLSTNICLGYCAADSSTAREFKSLIRSFPSFELMILISDITLIITKKCT